MIIQNTRMRCTSNEWKLEVQFFVLSTSVGNYKELNFDMACLVEINMVTIIKCRIQIELHALYL